MSAELVHDCPRCGANSITFIVRDAVLQYTNYDWQRVYEAFAICKRCMTTTVFVLSQKEARDGGQIKDKGALSFADSLDNHYRVEGHISLKDMAAHKPPEHVPDPIGRVFAEAATCFAVGCWNAAAVMFRTCIDLATRAMLPVGEVEGLNARARRDLGLRLPWLFEQGLLPVDLKGLSACIHQDGNDGAHQGNLTEADAADVLDFAEALLERLYTEPERLRLAEQRRQERRAPKR